MYKNYTAGKFCFLFSVFLIMCFQMLPIIVLMATSFSSESYLSFPPKGFSLQWYEKFFHSTAFTDSFIISLELAASSAAVSLLLGSVTAYAIDRSPFRRALTVFFGSPLMIPALIVGLALLQWFRMMHVGIGMTTLFIGQLVITLPYVIRGCLSSLYRFNLSLEEAAQTLGCTRIQTFYYVTIPLMKRSLIASGCFAFIISFSNLAISIFLSSARVSPLPVRLYGYANYTPDPMIAAISTCTLLLTMIFILIIEKTSHMNRM